MQYNAGQAGGRSGETSDGLVTLCSIMQARLVDAQVSTSNGLVTLCSIMQARLVDAQVSTSNGLVTLCSVPGQHNAGQTGGRSGETSDGLVTLCSVSLSAPTSTSAVHAASVQMPLLLGKDPIKGTVTEIFRVNSLEADSLMRPEIEY